MSARSGARPPRDPDADWLGWREAIETILAHCPVLPTERTQAAQAMRCAVAEDVTASIVHPPWDNSAMDGFAVHAADVLCDRALDGGDGGQSVNGSTRIDRSIRNHRRQQR